MTQSFTTMRDIGSTRGFVTCDPERQGVLVAMARRAQQSGGARSTTAAATAGSPGRQQDVLLRMQRPSSLTPASRA